MGLGVSSDASQTAATLAPPNARTAFSAASLAFCAAFWRFLNSLWVQGWVPTGTSTAECTPTHSWRPAAAVGGVRDAAARTHTHLLLMRAPFSSLRSSEYFSGSTNSAGVAMAAARKRRSRCFMEEEKKRCAVLLGEVATTKHTHTTLLRKTELHTLAGRVLGFCSLFCSGLAAAGPHSSSPITAPHPHGHLLTLLCSVCTQQVATQHAPRAINNNSTAKPPQEAHHTLAAPSRTPCVCCVDTWSLRG